MIRTFIVNHRFGWDIFGKDEQTVKESFFPSIFYQTRVAIGRVV